MNKEDLGRYLVGFAFIGISVVLYVVCIPQTPLILSDHSLSIGWFATFILFFIIAVFCALGIIIIVYPWNDDKQDLNDAIDRIKVLAKGEK